MDVQKHNLVGIELLRIVAMMMVVGLHYLNFGGILWSEAVMNRRIAWGIEAFLFVAVNCYVLISGYFLVKAKNFHWSKVGALWAHTAFYALLFTLAAIVYTGKWNLAGIVHSLLPIRYTMYWFVTAYMGMYILSPYLSRLACHLEKNEYKKFLMILTGLFVLYSFLQKMQIHSTSAVAIRWLGSAYYFSGGGVYSTFWRRLFAPLFPAKGFSDLCPGKPLYVPG